MKLKQLRSDLAQTWQVLRDLREALREGSPLEPTPGRQAVAPSRTKSAAPPEETIPFPPPRGISRCLLIFTVSASLALVGAGAIPREIIAPEDRLLYLENNPDRYDILFVGSSRIRVGLPVKSFDEHLRSFGVNLKPSFNMGAADAYMHQNFYVVRRLLDAGLRPRYLFVEASPFTSALRSSRIRGFELWHDFDETVRVLETTFEEDDLGEVYGSRIERTWLHLGYFLRRNLPLGRMLHFMQGRHSVKDTPSFLKSAGYKPIPRDGPSLMPEFQRYVEEPSLWEERIARLEDGYDGDYPRPVNLNAFVEFIAYVNSKDVKLVFIGTPFSEIDWVEPLLWMEQEGMVSATGDGETIPLFLNFNLPSLPYVKNLELRFDEGHTSNRGAELWTQDLAHASHELLKR